MSVRYDSPGHTCSGHAQPGTVALSGIILRAFPGSSSAGIYNCRPVRGGTTLSLHGEGRAADVKPTDRTQGDRLAAWAVANSARYSIQEVIWYRQRWSSSTDAWHAYHGVNPHTDHVHISQNWGGAQGSISGGIENDNLTIWGWLTLGAIVGGSVYALYKSKIL
jgi:hypothetical protein